MKKAFFFLPVLMFFVFSCKDDDTVVCTTCISTVTPPFELCREPDGTASVNGEYTGVNYDEYKQGLHNEGVECD